MIVLKSCHNIAGICIGICLGIRTAHIPTTAAIHRENITFSEKKKELSRVNQSSYSAYCTLEKVA